MSAYLVIGLLIVVALIIGLFKMKEENKNLRNELNDEKAAFDNLLKQKQK